MDALLENFGLVVFFALFAAGYFAGRFNERRHYTSLRRRESELSQVLVFSNRFPPLGAAWRDTRLVAGSAVISDDYFKSVLAGLYSLFGGRVRSYESLIDRARREAVLRMKAEAHKLGATMIFNVKFESVPLYKGQRNSIQSVEALVYGTAIIPTHPPAA